MDKILPPEDDEVSKEMAKIMKKKGIDIQLKSKVTKATVDKTKKCVELEIEDETGKIHKETFSKVLISIGRKPVTDKLKLDEVGVKTDSKGRIEVSLKADSLLKTSIDNI
jgi:dihydrolipoamide dehydrogenase